MSEFGDRSVEDEERERAGGSAGVREDGGTGVREDGGVGEREKGRERGSMKVREDGGVGAEVREENENDLTNTPTRPPAHTLKRTPSPPHTDNLSPSHTRTQTLWAALLIEELVRHGVGLFVLAPGSRCTPLTVAVAENPRANHLLHFDERGGAFAALGFARATGRPAAWVTTSGTAVANGLPAVVEADADGVPLILLTADRPPELRETGANQTIRQPGIFGPYVRWQVDLPVPDAAIDPAFVLTTVAQAAHRSRQPAGPVHINCMFRDPLAPEEDGLEAAEALPGLSDWLNGDRPYTLHPISSPNISTGEIEAISARLKGIERGLVVLGKSDDPDVAEAAERLAGALGWPLLPDVASGARLGGNAGAAFYDLVLGSSRFREQNTPEAIVHLGGKATSKRLQQYIVESSPADYLVVRPDAARYDPAHLVTDRIQSDVAQFCDALCGEFVPSSRPSSWMQVWNTASGAAERAVEETLNVDGLSEPGVARAVSRLTPEGFGLVVASSMPIRDVDAFAVAGGPTLRVTANRGASGIDGTVATAAGFARGLSRQTTLLIGDLALLHDLNSLALLRDSLPRARSGGPPVTVVVLNNDGGGIFNFLPIAGQEGLFEPYFGTPHGLGFEKAAHLFGLGYDQPESMTEFASAYTRATGAETSTVIEVRTNREENVTLHRALMDTVIEAVDESLTL